MICAIKSTAATRNRGDFNCNKFRNRKIKWASLCLLVCLSKHAFDRLVSFHIKYMWCEWWWRRSHFNRFCGQKFSRFSLNIIFFTHSFPFFCRIVSTNFSHCYVKKYFLFDEMFHLCQHQHPTFNIMIFNVNDKIFNVEIINPYSLINKTSSRLLINNAFLLTMLSLDSFIFIFIYREVKASAWEYDSIESNYFMDNANRPVCNI
jgi:hypothetical protein